MMQRLLLAILLFCAIAVPAVAQWTQTAGPSGGQFTAIAANSDVVLAANIKGDLYRYNGTTWSALGTLYAEQLYAGGGVFLATTMDRGLLRSTNNGDTWESTGIYNPFVVLGGFESQVYAGAGDSLYVSANYGMDWNLVTVIPDDDILAVNARGTTVAIMSLANGINSVIRVSTDGGKKWDSSISGLPADGIARSLTITGNTIYAAFLGKGIYRSTDGGTSWNPFNDGLDVDKYGEIVAIAVDVYGSSLWSVLPSGIYRYDGTSWKKMKEAVGALLATPSGNWQADELYMATSSSILQSTLDGEEWQDIAGGIHALSIRDIAYNGTTTVAASAGGIHRTTDAGAHWNSTLDNEVVELATSGTSFFARVADYSGLGLLRSTDQGGTWQQTVNGIDQSLDKISALTASGTNVFAGFGDRFDLGPGHSWNSGGIVRTTDNGDNWQTINDGLPTRDEAPVPIFALAAEGSSIVAVTAAGVYYSPSNGEYWHFAQSPSLALGSDITLESFNGTFYIGNRNVMLTSTDGGMTWEDMSIPLESASQAFITTLSIIRGRPVVMAMRQKAGSFAYEPVVFLWNGEMWQDITSRFPQEVEFGRLVDIGTTVLGGTQHRSIWSTSANWLTGQPASVPQNDDGTMIVASHPNPFTTESTIHINMEQSGRARLVVTDALGRTTAILHNGPLSAGIHQFHLNGEGWPAGPYFYQLILESKTVTRTIVKAD